MTAPGWTNRTMWTGDIPHIEFTQADIEKATSLHSPEQRSSGKAGIPWSHGPAAMDTRSGKLGSLTYRLSDKRQRALADRK